MIRSRHDNILFILFFFLSEGEWVSEEEAKWLLRFSSLHLVHVIF